MSFAEELVVDVRSVEMLNALVDQENDVTWGRILLSLERCSLSTASSALIKLFQVTYIETDQKLLNLLAKNRRWPCFWGKRASLFKLRTQPLPMYTLNIEKFVQNMHDIGPAGQV